MKKQIPDAHKSPTGWWVATVIERFVPYGQVVSSKTMCEVWENQILVRASNRDVAYSKIVTHGQNAAGPSPVKIGNQDGKWVFEGIASLLPVYDKFEDFGEI